MFTGIVSDVGTVRSASGAGDTRVVIGTAFDPAGIDLGASVACSGVCLTVVNKGTDAAGGWFAVDVSGETRARTAPDQWREGARLNLERALRLGEELGGHIVTGHVDGVGEVATAAPAGDSIRVEIAAPPELAPFIAPKGSVTVDGVSLTVNEVLDEDGRTVFALNLIPHTRAVTTLGELAPGRRVNLEIDVLARYLGRMEAYRARIR